jgi:putative acyl-CoA dehydrogenase
MLARRCVQHLVLAAQGSLMLQHAPSWAAQSFIASRIDAACGRMYGTLADEQMQWKVLERAWPV